MMSSAPSVGLLLPQIRMSFDTIAERVAVAESAGLDSVWFIDHLWTPGGTELDLYEGWTIATAVAARTSRIRVGHMVLCDAFRSPALLAKMATTLDAVSAGRLDLGMGWGSVPAELEAFGFGDPGTRARAARLAETLTVLELLFTGEPVDFEGEFHQLRGAVCRPVPVQRPIPVHVGGAGPELTLPIVRRHAAWWNCPSYGVARLGELRPSVGDVRVSVQHPVALIGPGDDPAEVEAVAARRFGGWGGLLCGTAEELADQLAGEVALGVDGFVIALTDFARPETIERFAAEVVPAVRARIGRERPSAEVPR